MEVKKYIFSKIIFHTNGPTLDSTVQPVMQPGPACTGEQSLVLATIRLQVVISSEIRVIDTMVSGDT